jgi:hypothetical protein
MLKEAAPTRQRRHDCGLTLPQEKAVDLLALGQSDTKVAEQVGVARETVCRWRCHSPTFQAELNARRAALFQASADRLRVLTEKALAVLGDVLDNSCRPFQIKAAVAVLRLARLPGAAEGIGDQDANSIVRKAVEADRTNARDTLEDMWEEDDGLPPLDEHMARKWDELDSLANGQSTNEPAG